MAKKFCTTGTCIPEKNYMVDLSNRIQQIINQYIESGQYFTINRARQYGKTTLLYLLEKELRKQDYLVLSLSFEAADEVANMPQNHAVLLPLANDLGFDRIFARIKISPQFFNGLCHFVRMDSHRTTGK